MRAPSTASPHQAAESGPAWSSEFPENRENNRESLKTWPDSTAWSEFGSPSPSGFKSLQPISLLLREQGFRPSEQETYPDWFHRPRYFPHSGDKRVFA